jgi:Flp pilus assembly protein TadD
VKPDVVTTSASAAIFGIVGSLVPASLPISRNRTNPELRLTWVLVWFGMSALNLARLDGEGTASLAVLGGLFAGLALGVFLRPRPEETERSRPLVFLGALVVLIAGSQMVRYAAAHVLRRERGISAYTAGRYDPAVRELEAAVREKPADSYAQAVLGEAYLHQYEYDKAEVPLKQALAISPHYDYASRALAYEQATTRGIAAYESDDYVAAISDLETAASARPDDAYVQFLLGSSYFRADDYDHAEEPLQRALTLCPGYTDAEEGLAYIHTVTDRDEDGLKEYSDVVRQNPDNESARLGMGTALNNLERYDEAIAVFKEAVRRHPDSAEAHYSLGFAYSDSERYDQAIASLRQALRLQPKYPEAQKELADALRCQKKNRTARPE